MLRPRKPTMVEDKPTERPIPQSPPGCHRTPHRKGRALTIQMARLWTLAEPEMTRYATWVQPITT